MSEAIHQAYRPGNSDSRLSPALSAPLKRRSTEDKAAYMAGFQTGILMVLVLYRHPRGVHDQILHFADGMRKESPDAFGEPTDLLLRSWRRNDIAPGENR